MRNPDSLFNHVCTFINKVPVGQTFLTKDYTWKVGCHERATRWKGDRNKFYITYGYRGLLRQAKFVKNTKRGEWQVLRHIPEWFDLGHLKFILGHSWDYKNNCRPTTYNGMTKQEILDRLENKNNPTVIAVRTAIAGSAEPKTYNPGNDLNHFQNMLHAASSIPFAGYSEEEFNKLEETKEYSSGTKVCGSYGCTVEKITKEESQFTDQPKREIPTQEIVNLGLIRSSIASLDLITTKDSILHARIVNALSILQDIEESMSSKIDAQIFTGKL